MNIAGQLQRLQRERPNEFVAFLDECTAAEIAAIRSELDCLEVAGQEWTPLPHQVAPGGRWRTWMLRGGRGSGKTDALSHFVKSHIEGPPCDPRVPGGHRVIAISPTIGDAASALAMGPSSIPAHLPGARLKSGVVAGTGGVYIVCPNGAQIRLTGARTEEDEDRLRAAGNTCLAVCDELGAWRRYTVWVHMRLGLRLGPNPQTVIATTPRRSKLYMKLDGDPRVIKTHATTDDNPHLDAEIRRELYDDYGDTHLGRQELGGELLEDVEGALWTLVLIEAAQGHGMPGPLRRTTVGVDPSGSEDGDETGIVAVGEDEDAVLWVLEDASTRGTPEARYKAVVLLAVRHHAGTIVYEAAYGGDNVLAGIRQAWRDYGEGIEPRYVKASVEGGKMGRAEPVAALYEKQLAKPEEPRIRHLPGLEQLEDQQRTWEPDEPWSPDRMDAMVHAVRHLAGGRLGLVTVQVPPKDRMVRTGRVNVQPPAWGRPANGNGNGHAQAD